MKGKPVMKTHIDCISSKRIIRLPGKTPILTFLLTKCTCLAPTEIRGGGGGGYFLPAYICEQGISTCYTEFEYGTCTMRCWQMIRDSELSEERKNLNAQRIKQNTFKKKKKLESGQYERMGRFLQ